MTRPAVITIFFWTVFLCSVFAQNTVEIKINSLAKKHLDTVCKECRVDISIKWAPGRVTELDSSDIRFLKFSSGLPRGYQNATVYYQQERQKKNAEIQFYIRVLKRLPVAANRILSGDLLSDDDLAYQWVDVSRMQILPVFSLERLRGQTSGRIIKKGSVFWEKDFEAVPLVEAGNPVKLLYRETGIEVQIQCVARESKAAGESIRLYSKETGTIYIGKVINQSKAIWERTL